MMKCSECGSVEFGVTYKNNYEHSTKWTWKRPENKRELNKLYCKKCGQFYTWVDNYFHIERGLKVFVKEEKSNIEIIGNIYENSDYTLRCVDDIIKDIRDRVGLGDEWDNIDEEIQKSIKRTWSNIIAKEIFL